MHYVQPRQIDFLLDYLYGLADIFDFVSGVFFAGGYALDAEHLAVAGEAEEGDFVHGVVFAVLAVVAFFAGAGGFALGEEVFGGGGGDIFEGVFLGFDFPVDGFDEVGFFLVFGVNFIFGGKTFSWVEAWDNLLFEGFVDEVDKDGVQFGDGVALGAVDGGLVLHRNSTFYVHKCSAQYAEYMLAF